MALDVYFRDDIRNILRSAYIAGEGPAALVAELLQAPELGGVPMTKLLRVYREGYLQALNAVGLAFGLDLSLPAPVNRSPPTPRSRTVALPVDPARGNGRSMVERESGDESMLEEFDMTRFLWVKSQYEKRK